jgi:diadenosine tetraphosphate (Ap4A) HIT family hydrolase
MDADFILDSRLENDSVFVSNGPLSQYRLMNDARFPWLVLVPRMASASEWIDLPQTQQNVLLEEINHAGKMLREHFPCEKINIGALGNIVRQLHVHVIARTEHDAAWPAPVWGFGVRKAYAESRLAELTEKLRAGLVHAA